MTEQAQAGLSDIIYCSLDLSTRDGKVNAMNALGETTFKAAAMELDYMPVKDVIIHKVNVKGTDAERTILLLEDGDSVSFVSDGIVNQIKRVMEIFGRPTWSPAIEMKVVKVPTTQGNTYNIKVK